MAKISYWCTLCEKQYSTQELIKHIEEKFHPNKKHYICDYTDKEKWLK